jgi:hypothetical protein
MRESLVATQAVIPKIRGIIPKICCGQVSESRDWKPEFAPRAAHSFMCVCVCVCVCVCSLHSVCLNEGKQTLFSGQNEAMQLLGRQAPKQSLQKHYVPAC